jgi:hypothetical protein
VRRMGIQPATINKCIAAAEWAPKKKGAGGKSKS